MTSLLTAKTPEGNPGSAVEEELRVFYFTNTWLASCFSITRSQTLNCALLLLTLATKLFMSPVKSKRNPHNTSAILTLEMVRNELLLNTYIWVLLTVDAFDTE